MFNRKCKRTTVTRDTVYAQPQATIAGFSFNEAVAEVFADMISRSVPGYELTLQMLGIFSDNYAVANTCCYDLGCSLGASTFAIQATAPASCRIVGIDNAPAMVKRARELLQLQPLPNVTIVESDVLTVDFEPASVIASNFTLQFIAPPQRLPLLQRIHNSLVAGGVLVLSEKIDFENPGYRRQMTDLYHSFKRSRGYSELEVAQKRSALENVLIPETLATHTNRLHQAGFSQILPWYQCFNFCSLIAVK